jgi:sRNA-binding regulator protein Hfq
VPTAKGKTARPVEQTFEETRYLKHLIDRKIPICVKLADNDQVTGVVEYYDQRFIRVTRKDGPNLFIFKHDIKYLYEVPHS